MGTPLEGENGATDLAWRQVVLLYAETYLLSPRELRVLEGAVAGFQDKGIAASCACSRSTVATYWKRIFAKTGVRPQREVLAHLLRFACDRMPAPEPASQAESEVRIRIDVADVERRPDWQSEAPLHPLRDWRERPSSEERSDSRKGWGAPEPRFFGGARSAPGNVPADEAKNEIENLELCARAIRVRAQLGNP